MENCDNESFAEQKGTIVAAFAHMEAVLQSNFADRDIEIIQRTEREKKRARTSNDDDLPEERPQLSGESPTPPASKQSQSKSSKGTKEEYVEYMKRSRGNATICTRFNEPVDLRSIADEQEGGAFNLSNRDVGISGPELSQLPPKCQRSQSYPRQERKAAYQQIRPECDRGNIEVISQCGTTYCFKSWNGEKGATRSGFLRPPSFDPNDFIRKNSDDYLTVHAISRRVNRVLRQESKSDRIFRTRT